VIGNGCFVERELAKVFLTEMPGLRGVNGCNQDDKILTKSE